MEPLKVKCTRATSVVGVAQGDVFVQGSKGGATHTFFNEEGDETAAPPSSSGTSSIVPMIDSDDEQLPQSQPHEATGASSGDPDRALEAALVATSLSWSYWNRDPKRQTRKCRVS